MKKTKAEILILRSIWQKQAKKNDDQLITSQKQLNSAFKMRNKLRGAVSAAT